MTRGLSVAIIVASIIAAVSACGGNAPDAQSPSAVGLNATRMAAPHGLLSGLAWLSDGSIVTSLFTSAPSGTTAELWEVGSAVEAHVLPVSEAAGCRLSLQLRPYARPDGSLIYVRECGDGPAPQLRVWAASGQDRVLLEGVPSGIHGLSWDPLSGRALISQGSVICERLLWASSAGLAAPAVRVTGDERTFDLSDPSSVTECSRTGRAFLPAIDAQGRTAFFGSTASVGVDGQDRLDAPSRIYLITEGDEQASAASDDVYHPQSLRWSPDGQTLAFSGVIARRGAGIWILNLASGVVTPVVFGTYADVAWSPDGHRLGAIEQSTDDDDHVVILDLPDP